LLFRAGELEKAVRVRYAEGGYALEFDGQESWVRGELGPDASLRVDLGGLRSNAAVVVAGERRYVFLQGRSWPLARIDPLYYGGEGGGPEGGLLAPMPGNVIALLVGGGTLALIMLLKRNKRIPGILIAVISATVLVATLELDTRGLSVLGSLPQGLPAFAIPWITPADVASVLMGGFAVAIVSFADTSVLSRTPQPLAP